MKGPIEDAFDGRIQGIVDTWPTEVDASRSVSLGLLKPPPLEEIIGQYLEAFGSDRKTVAAACSFEQPLAIQFLCDTSRLNQSSLPKTENASLN